MGYSYVPTIRNSRLATLPLAILLPLSSAWSPLCVRKAHLRCSLFHWGLRTGLRFAGPVFRGCGALRAVLAPPPLRGFDGCGLLRPKGARFVRPLWERGAFWLVVRRREQPCPRASYYIRVVFIDLSPEVCYTVGDAVDWCHVPTARRFKGGSNHSPLPDC